MPLERGLRLVKLLGETVDCPQTSHSISGDAAQLITRLLPSWRVLCRQARL